MTSPGKAPSRFSGKVVSLATRAQCSTLFATGYWCYPLVELRRGTDGAPLAPQRVCFSALRGARLLRCLAGLAACNNRQQLMW
jgi:hypothetical protein